MAEVTKGRTGEFIRKLFDILIQHADGMHGRDAIAALRKKVELTEYEKGAYPTAQPGVTRFEIIVRFATTYCAKAAWLLKQKGRWTITEEGKKAFADPALLDPEAFYREAVKRYREWKASQPGEGPPGEIDDGNAGIAVGITYERAVEQARAEIEQYLHGMEPFDFQELVAALLRAMGYHVSWVAPPGRDGGIDIVAWSDPLGTRPPRIKVQVKRVGQKVSVDGLRSFMAVLGADDAGLFVSTGGFTKDAEEAARTQETRKVTLVNLEKLFDLWVEYYAQLTVDARRWLPLRPIQFLDPVAVG
jgi:restriction system protein